MARQSENQDVLVSTTVKSAAETQEQDPHSLRSNSKRRTGLVPLSLHWAQGQLERVQTGYYQAALWTLETAFLDPSN
jgi:hypothetical protein